MAVLEDGLDHGPVLLHELPGPLARDPGRVLHRLRLHEQAVARGTFTEAGDGGTEDGAVQGAHHHAPGAIGQAARLFDLRHRADLGVDGGPILGRDPGDEHKEALAGQGRVGRRLGLIALQPERHDHLRQHDPCREGQERQEPGLHV